MQIGTGSSSLVENRSRKYILKILKLERTRLKITCRKDSERQGPAGKCGALLAACLGGEEVSLSGNISDSTDKEGKSFTLKRGWGKSIRRPEAGVQRAGVDNARETKRNKHVSP